MSYYETLEVSKDATSDEIKQAYRKLAKKYHPDKNPGDNNAKAKFQEIQEAYSILSDEQKRNQYDSRGYEGSIEDILRRYGFGSNFADDFNMHFGGFRTNPNAKGSDVRVTIPITLSEIYTGATRTINIGSGPQEINIPKGARDGGKYKMAGKGQPNAYNSQAPHGDLIIQINIAYDYNFIIQGDDIMVERYVPFYDMILGTNVEVSLPTGQKISIKVPPNAAPGKVLRVAGKGLPIFGTEEAGALLIKIVTDFKNLNEEQISLINKVKELAND